MNWATPEQVSVKKDFSFPSTTTRRLQREGGGSYWTVGLHVARWIEANCVLTAASFAGKQFKLLPWQWRFLAELFEVVPADGNPDDKVDWVLKHRWCLLGLPKKNGKSELIGGLALFFLLGTDEVDPRIFVAASTEDQANMVYAPVQYMAEHSPTLSALVSSKMRTVVSRASRGGFIRRLAAVGGANDGANVYVALIDEFHEWTGARGRDVWNVITNGTVMRDEPMIIQITTAGYDEDTLCYEWYEQGMSQLDGSVEDPASYFCWFGAPDDADWKDVREVEKVNPSFGAIMKAPFYVDQQTKKTEAVYRRYFLNQWTEAEDIWAAASKWDELVIEGGTIPFDLRSRTYCGIDIGRKIDSSAVVVVQMKDGKAYVSQKIWTNPFGKGDPRRTQWRMNIDELNGFLHDIADFCPAPSGWDADEKNPQRIAGPLFMYDPHLFGTHADKLTDEGLNMQEFPQTDAQMVPASQLLFEWIMNGEQKLFHDGDPEMRSHIRSVVAKQKERGWRISRPTGSNKHIDGAVALAMALRAAVVNEVIETDGSSETNIW